MLNVKTAAVIGTGTMGNFLRDEGVGRKRI